MMSRLPIGFNRNPGAWRGINARNPVTGGFPMRNAMALVDDPSRLHTTGRERYAIPTYNQVGSTCGGEGSCNALETAWRAALGDTIVRQVVTHVLGEPQEWQFDGYKAYMLARRRFYDDQDVNAGLYINEAWQALIDEGILPPGSRIDVLPDDWDAINHSLAHGKPTICAIAVDEGDLNANGENGQIDEETVTEGWLAGHCEAVLNLLVQTGTLFVQDQGSWGREYAWHGLILRSAKRVQLAMVDHFHTLELPEGWERWEGLHELIVPMREPPLESDDDGSVGSIQPPEIPHE